MTSIASSLGAEIKDAILTFISAGRSIHSNQLGIS